MCLVMHWMMMTMMTVMNNFFVMDRPVGLGHRCTCHSHQDQDRQEDLFHF